MVVKPLPSTYLARITLAEFQSGDQAAHDRLVAATARWVNIACVLRRGADGPVAYEVWGDPPDGFATVTFEDGSVFLAPIEMVKA